MSRARQQLIEAELTKADVKKLIDDELKKAMEKLDKKILTKDDVKEMIRATIIAQYKFLWQKSAFFINQI